MSVRRQSLVRAAGVLALALMLPGGPASAQGFFEMLFNGDRYAPRQRPYAPPQSNAYNDPYGAPTPDPYGAPPAASGGTGRPVAYCVRLCDGRYFPMQRHSNANSIQLCNAFCPASKTQVFNGSQIDHAAASNGARYADLDNAFVYREKIVAGCTCNGKDSFGLARIDVASDPTLRPGDIVATGDNVKVALTAMQAAKERGRDRDTAAAERTARRTATATPPAASASPAAKPAEVTDDIPED